jgi:hypothetical protein
MTELQPRSRGPASHAAKPRSKDAIRMQRMRDRRKAGEICLPHLTLDPWHVSGLVVGGWLDRNRRYDPRAVADAFARFVAAALDQRRNPRGRADTVWR